MTNKDVNSWLTKGNNYNMMNHYSNVGVTVQPYQNCCVYHSAQVTPTTMGVNWYPSITLTYDDVVSNSELKLKFHLPVDLMSFGNLNGYNGCISFVFYKGTNIFTIDNNTAFAENLHFTNYRSEIQANMTVPYYKTGGLGTRMCADQTTYGVCLTLYPFSMDGTGIPQDIDETNQLIARYYKMVVKSYTGSDVNKDLIVIQGYLPNGINLANSTELMLTKNASDMSNSLSINGTVLERFYSFNNNSFYNMSNMRFAVNTMGAWNYPSAIALESFEC